jgi:nitrogen-specific signal transduction histidine kinase/ActR/RegA family two-component response regulator
MDHVKKCIHQGLLLCYNDEKGRAITLDKKISQSPVLQDTVEKDDLTTTPQESSQSFSGFLSGIIHEIRTPMNAIVGFSQLLEEITEKEDQLDYIHQIQEASKHLLEIVNDALDLSKIESGKVQIEERSFDIDVLLKSVLSIFEDTRQQKKLYLDVEKINVPKVMIGDSSRIRQILINLVSNAIKFTDQGGVSIVISTETMPYSSRIQLIIKVKDTGIGMTKDQQDRLFQDFTQANRSTTRLFGGSGLGLSISQKLAHLMQGEITAFGKPQEGSTFILTLPVKMDDDKALDSGNDLEKNAQLKPGSRILISEDNLLSMKLITRILTNFGMVVTAVPNGKLAFEHALKHTYELIILDLETPEIGGLEAARLIRSHDINTSIIALSAHQKSDVEPSCKSVGIHEVIQKPIDHKSLHKALIKWMPLVINNQEGT